MMNWKSHSKISWQHMKTETKIIKTEQKIARLERQLAMDKIKKRKADTHRKIQFGGLVIKAKMDVYPKDIILGALLDAAQRLENEVGTESLYQSKGHAVFMGFDDE